MKKIEDYLHLYLGCEVQISWYYASDERKLHTVFVDPIGPEFLKNKGNTDSPNIGKVEFKPILRPLSSMTEGEAAEAKLFDKKVDAEVDEKIKGVAEMTKYFLSKGFDLFNLIESGLAINRIVEQTLEKKISEIVGEENIGAIKAILTLFKEHSEELIPELKYEVEQIKKTSYEKLRLCGYQDCIHDLGLIIKEKFPKSSLQGTGSQ